MAVSPRPLIVPDLTDIETRDGLRTFIRNLHLHLRQYSTNQDGFNQSVTRSMTPLTWAAPIASAATIEPLGPVQPITGSVSISQINPGPITRVILLSQAGFALLTGGNIAVAMLAPAGTSVELFLNHTDNLWYPQRSDAGFMGANGQRLETKMLSELTTVAAAATTDTAIQMPAHAIILAVPVRVTVLIPTAANFTVGDSGSAARFNTGSNVAVAAGTTNQGTKAGAYYNASALPIRLTPDLTPANNTGRVRVSIFYIEVTPPTS